MIGLILGGGGARGAYEAGVVRYLYTEFTQKTGIVFRPKVYCGTSIGALGAAWIAAAAEDSPRYLSYYWQTLLPGHVYRFGVGEMARALWGFLRAPGTGRGFALFDAEPLYDLIGNVLPWARLYERLDRGEVHSVVVSATEVASGRCVLFHDGNGRIRRDTPTTRACHTRLNPTHVLASAAIPLIFPAITVDRRYYVDGGLRQNTPLSPAIELGVDRALLVTVQHEKVADTAPNVPPAPGFLAGKAMEALLIDNVDEDLRRVESFNRLLRWGTRTYPDFSEALATGLRPYNEVRTLVVRPSEPLGRIAVSAWAKVRDELPWGTRALFRAAGEPGEDLLSMLLFHHAYTGEIEALGFSDARCMEGALAELLGEDGA